MEKQDIDSTRLSAWPEYEWRRDERHYLGEAVRADSRGEPRFSFAKQRISAQLEIRYALD